MTGCLRMSTAGASKDAHHSEGVAKARRERTSCWIAWPNACVAAALASVLVVGSPDEAVAQTPGAVWAGCDLEPATVAALKSEMPQTGNNRFVQNGAVAFVVIYTMKDNDGQEFAVGPNGGQFTGPVICINDDAVEGVGIAATSQSATIPSGSDATAVNTLDAEEVFILRYALANGNNAGTVEKILCHAVNDRMDCFRISPLL